MDWHFEIIRVENRFFTHITTPVVFMVIMVVHDGDSMQSIDIHPCETKEMAEELLSAIERLDQWYRKFIGKE